MITTIRKQVISRVLFILLRWAIIYLGLELLHSLKRRLKVDYVMVINLLSLAPSRGLPSQHFSMLLVRSYRTFAPLPVLEAYASLCCHRRCVSVALSSRLPALGVTQQVWSFRSPDFPQTILMAVAIRIVCDYLSCFQSP